jgi:hypothetical protein
MQVFAVLVANLVKPPPSTVASGKRGPASNKYALELDGRHCGWLTDLAGGMSVGELGSAARYDELTLRCWPAMPLGFYQWVARSFAEGPAGADGLLQLADDDFRELSRLRWSDGVVTEFATSAIDLAVPELMKVMLKFSPRTTQRGEPSPVAPSELNGAALDTRWPAPAGPPGLQIDGLEEACCHFKRIEGLAIRQRVRRAPGRCEREAGISAAPLVVTLPEAKAQGFVRWLEACEAGKSNGRAATLVIGAPTVGFTVALGGLRPARIDEVAVDGDDPRRRDLRVELRARDVAFALAQGK